MHSKRLSLIFVFILIFLLSVIVAPQDDNNGGGDITYDLDKYYDYQDKQGYFRDEYFLEDLVATPYKHHFIEDSEDEENDEDYYEINDDPFTPQLERSYYKPISKNFKVWNFYLDYGLYEVKYERDLKKLNSYYISYYNSSNGKLLRVELKKNHNVKMMYIYNDIEKPRYELDFDNYIYKDYIYNDKALLIKTNIYRDAKLESYRTYYYYSNRIEKLIRSYKYDGTPDGTWIVNDKNGHKIEETEWLNGTEISKIYYYYDDKGVETERQFYKKDHDTSEIILLKYWLREKDKIYYYNSNDEKISWTDFSSM